MQRNDLLVWMDLEMTSLEDTSKDSIIEIAAIITDSDLALIAEGPDIVIHADRAQFERISPEVRAIHEKSGIIEASVASVTTIAEAERAMLSFLEEHVAPDSSPLCGNSIYMDRLFIRAQMPALNRYLHYRLIDVSTIKALARRWKPSLYEEWVDARREKSHRAKDDILQSIDELRFYRERFFAL